MDGLSIHDVVARGDFITWLKTTGFPWTFENFNEFVQSRQSEALEYLFNAIFSNNVHQDDAELRSLFESWSSVMERQRPDSN